MNTLNNLLDKAREMCGSDLATASKLRVTRSAVSKWRHGGKIDPAQLARLIALTQQDAALAVQVLAEQDAPPEERRMWGVVWDRLSPVTTKVAGVLLAFGLAAPYPADAAPMAQAEPLDSFGIMRIRRWVAQMLQAWRHEPSAVLA